jgi:PAS domain S-box-containing protein
MSSTSDYQHNNKGDSELLIKEKSPIKDPDYVNKIFQGSSIAALILRQSDKVIVDVNKAFLDLTECRLEEVIGQNVSVLNMLLVDPYPVQKRTTDTLQAFGQIINDAASLKTKSGKLHQVTYHSLQMKINDENFSVTLITDVTEYKKAEESLKESEEKYRSIVETTNEGIWMSSPDGKTIFVNQRMADMLGYNKEEILGHCGIEFVDIQLQPKIFENREKLNNKKALQTECKFIKKDGSALWTLVNTVQISSESKHPINIAMHTDITERKKTEDALKRNEERFRVALNNSPITLIEFDTDLKFKWIYNPLVKLDSEQIIGKIIGETGTVEDITPLKNFYFEVLRTGIPKRKEVMLKHPWKTAYYDVYAEPIRDASGKITGLSTASTDITPFKKSEERLRKTQAKLKEYVLSLEKIIDEKTKQLLAKERLAAIGATAGMVGHDIRNPLQAMVSEIFLAKQELNNLPEGTRYIAPKKMMIESLDSIEENIFYINKIVADLQDFSRPLELTKTDLDLEDLLKKAFDPKFIPKGYQAEYRLEDNVKTVYADLTLLKRILNNLGLNAIQAMPNGGKVLIRVSQNQTHTIISVEDHGEGIPENCKNKIFTPMFTTKSKGQGLGLAVVKRLVEAQGGTVRFESQVNVGTKFIVELPIHA